MLEERWRAVLPRRANTLYFTFLPPGSRWSRERAPCQHSAVITTGPRGVYTRSFRIPIAGVPRRPAALDALTSVLFPTSSPRRSPTRCPVRRFETPMARSAEFCAWPEQKRGAYRQRSGRTARRVCLVHLGRSPQGSRHDHSAHRSTLTALLVAAGSLVAKRPPPARQVKSFTSRSLDQRAVGAWRVGVAAWWSRRAPPLVRRDRPRRCSRMHASSHRPLDRDGRRAEPSPRRTIRVVSRAARELAKKNCALSRFTSLPVFLSLAARPWQRAQATARVA